MCYTLINVPYGALNASLTRDTNEITVLTSVRMFLANLGGLAVAYGIPILVKVLSPDGKINTTASANAWFITMTIYAVIGLALLMFCFSQTKERVVMDQEETSKVKVSDLWVEFCRNKPLRILAFFFITAFAMMAIGNSAGSYYMIYNVRAPEMLPYFMVLWARYPHSFSCRWYLPLNVPLEKKANVLCIPFSRYIGYGIAVYYFCGSGTQNADMVGLCGAVHKIDGSHYCDRVYVGFGSRSNFVWRIYSW